MSLLFSKHALFLSLLLHSSFQSNTPDFRSMKMNTNKDQKFVLTNIQSSAISVSVRRTAMQCRADCLANEQCKTVNFFSSNGVCELFNDIPGANGQLVSSVGALNMIVVDNSRYPTGKPFSWSIRGKITNNCVSRLYIRQTN